MTSLFKGRTSTDSQRPQSRRSLKSRLSFSAQSKENILEALPSEDVPPVPPLPASETKEAREEVSEKPLAPVAATDAVQQTQTSAPPETKGESVMPAPSTDKPLPTPAAAPSAEPVVKKSRHSRHDSAMQAPTPPKRSSSFKSVLNTYYKIFGGSPKKTPKHEKLPEEAERLRRLVKKYEAQLEEASNILLLQDKVIARWEKDAATKGIPVTEVTSNGVSAIVPVETPVEKAVEPEPMTSDSKAAEDVPEGSRSLGLIRESSKEMLSEIAAQQAEAGEATQDVQPTIRLVEDESDKAAELESTKRDLAAAQAAADGYAKRYHELEKSAEQSATALAQASAAKDKLENDLAILKAELDTTKRTQEEPVAADTSVFDEERSTLKSRIEELEIQLSAAKASAEAQARDHDEHKISLAKELETAHAAKISSASDVERLTSSLEELQKSHANITTEHESTKFSLAAQLALVATHEASLKRKDDDWNGLTETHEKALAESTSQLNAASSKFQSLAAEHEALQLKHTEAIAALDSAKNEAFAASETLSGEHQVALAALTKDLDASKAQLEETNALAESLKKEHTEAHAALNAELELQRSSLEKVTNDAKGHEDRALRLDEEVQAVKTAHKNSEAAHLATKAELDSFIADKTGLEARIAAFTTASAGHGAQVAELEKVNKELAELRLELEGHATTKSDLEAKIATLQSDADGHVAARSDLETSRAKIAEVESQAEGHATSRMELEAKIASLEDDIGKHGTNASELQSKIAELESSVEGHATAKSELESMIAALRADAETHASTVSDLEVSRTRAIELESQVEKHEATKAELEAAHAHIVELKTISEAHEIQKTELAEAKIQIESLSKDIEAHEAAKKDLTTAQTLIADLEKSLESGKADHATITEKLSSVEASLATATGDHEKLTASLSERETALQQALKTLETQNSQLSEKASALTEAQEALEKAKADASQASMLTKDLNAAEDKVRSLEQELVSSNEKHEAEKASLSSKVKDIWRLREQNDLLQQQLAAAQESERTAKSSVTKLEADLRSAKAVQPILAHEEDKDDDESSGLGKAALAVGALGAVGAGAFGVSKLLDDDEEDEPVNKEQSESVALPEVLPAKKTSEALPSAEHVEERLDRENPDSKEPINERPVDDKPVDEEPLPWKGLDGEAIDLEPLAEKAVDATPAEQDLVEPASLKQESVKQDSNLDHSVAEQPAAEQLTEDAPIEEKLLSAASTAGHSTTDNLTTDESPNGVQHDENRDVEAHTSLEALPEDPVAKAVVDSDGVAPVGESTGEPLAELLHVDDADKSDSGDAPVEASASTNLPSEATEEVDAKSLSVETETPSVEAVKDANDFTPAEPLSAIGFTPIESYPESAIEAPVSKLPPVDEALAEGAEDEELDANLKDELLEKEPAASDSPPLGTSSKPEAIEPDQTASDNVSDAEPAVPEAPTSEAEEGEPSREIGDQAHEDSAPRNESSKPDDALPLVATQQESDSAPEDTEASRVTAPSVDEAKGEIFADKTAPVETASIGQGSVEQVPPFTEPESTTTVTEPQPDETVSEAEGPGVLSARDISESVTASAPPADDDQLDKDVAPDGVVADEEDSVENLAASSAIDKEPKDDASLDVDAPQASAPVQAEKPKVASTALDEPQSETLLQEDAAGEEVTEPERTVDLEQVADSVPIDGSDSIAESIPAPSINNGDDGHEKDLLDQNQADHNASATLEAADDSASKTDVDASTMLVPLPGEASAAQTAHSPESREATEIAISDALTSEFAQLPVIGHTEQSAVVPSSSELGNKSADPSAINKDTATSDVIAEEAPKIKCLTCGDNIDIDGLAEHFCTPAASPLEASEAATALNATHVDTSTEDTEGKDVISEDSAVDVPAARPSNANSDENAYADDGLPAERQPATDNFAPAAASDVQGGADTALAVNDREVTTKPLPNEDDEVIVLSGVTPTVDTSIESEPSLVTEKDAEGDDNVVKHDHFPADQESAVILAEAVKTPDASAVETSEIEDLEQGDATEISTLPARSSTVGSDTKSKNAKDLDATSETLVEDIGLATGDSDVAHDATLDSGDLPKEDPLSHADKNSVSEKPTKADAVSEEGSDTFEENLNTPDPKDGDENITNAHDAVEAKSDQELEPGEVKSTPACQPELKATGSDDGTDVLEVKHDQTATAVSGELDAAANEASPKLVPTSVIDIEDAPKATSAVDSIEPESHSPPTLGQAVDNNATADESAIQQSPATPQTPSKRKSVRWEDIESSKQSTPVEELEKQLDAPIVNGDHAETTAEKHSVGPGSPEAEFKGLAITDVTLSEEPEATLDDDKISDLPVSVTEQLSSAKGKVTSSGEEEDNSKESGQLEDFRDTSLQAENEAPQSTRDDLNSEVIQPVNHANPGVGVHEAIPATAQADIKTPAVEALDDDRSGNAEETKNDAQEAKAKADDEVDTATVDYKPTEEHKVLETDVEVNSEPLSHDDNGKTGSIVSDDKVSVREDDMPSNDNPKDSLEPEPSIVVDRSQEEGASPVVHGEPVDAKGGESQLGWEDDDDAAKEPVVLSDTLEESDALNAGMSNGSSLVGGAQGPSADAIVDSEEQVSEVKPANTPNTDDKRHGAVGVEVEEPKLPAASPAKIEVDIEQPSAIDRKEDLPVDDDDGETEPKKDLIAGASANTTPKNSTLELEKDDELQDGTVAGTLDDAAGGASQAEPKNTETSVIAQDRGKDEADTRDDDEPGLGQKLAAKTSDLVSIVKDKLTPSKDDEAEK